MTKLNDNELNITQEIHPEWYHHIDDMRTLILGTYPPHEKRRDFEFYYPNTQNRFWNILASIANFKLTELEGPKAVAQRKELMQILKVGVQNVGKVIKRKGESALDTDIEILEYQDLLTVINSSKKLDAIALTGYSGKTSTYSSFIKYLKQNNVPFTKPSQVKAGYAFEINCNRPIKCIITNSTSTTAARSGVTFEMVVDQFSNILKPR